MRTESRVGYLRWRWSHPWTELARDTVVLVRGGELIGYAEQYHEGGEGPSMAGGRVDPGWLDRDLGSWLATWCLEGARRRGVTIVRTACPAPDDRGRRLLSAMGFHQVRSSIDMGVLLEAEPPSPVLPGGIAVRPFREADVYALWRVSSEAFRDHWDHVREPTFEEFTAEWFGDPTQTARILLAVGDEGVVGELGWIPDDGDAYVFSIGVLPAYRRRGIAGCLLRAAMRDAAAESMVHLSLSVDAESPTGAVGVYERAGLEPWRTMLVFDRVVA